MINACVNPRVVSALVMLLIATGETVRVPSVEKLLLSACLIDMQTINLRYGFERRKCEIVYADDVGMCEAHV